MSKRKKIVCVVLTIIVAMIVHLWLKQIEQMPEGESNYIYEVGRQKREQYVELISYCKEHEDMYMEISEQVFGYMDEGLSVKEACAAMENNATSEQKEILRQTILRHSSYSNGDM